MMISAKRTIGCLTLLACFTTVAQAGEKYFTNTETSGSPLIVILAASGENIAITVKPKERLLISYKATNADTLTFIVNNKTINKKDSDGINRNTQFFINGDGGVSMSPDNP